MAKIFFLSSIGDTDLALKTIENLEGEIFVVPLTVTAENRIRSSARTFRIISLSEIGPDNINAFIADNGITNAFVGVPSPVDEVFPYQLASTINIPCVVAYEFMFNTQQHGFWQHLPAMAENSNVRFAVPLPAARDALIAYDGRVKTDIVGHISIDAAQQPKVIDAPAIKARLGITEAQQYGFMSGTTQPHDVDDNFLKAVLEALNSGDYPNLQLRMGLHPGVKNPAEYLGKLLATCQAYTGLSKQFKIVVTPKLAGLINNDALLTNDFILRQDISGQEMADAADFVSQAVPGALINEAVIKGKGAYFHADVEPYLRHSFFAGSIKDLLATTASQSIPPSREDLSLSEATCGVALANLMR